MKKSFLNLVILIMFFLVSCSDGGNKEAIPFSQEKLLEWQKRIKKALTNIEHPANTIDEKIEITKKVFKITCEDMGYNFDKTILKMAATPPVSEDVVPPAYLPLYVLFQELIVKLVEKYPDRVVKKDLLKEDTVKKLQIWRKFSEITKSDINFLGKFLSVCNNECLLKNFFEFLRKEFCPPSWKIKEINGRVVDLNSLPIKDLVCHPDYGTSFEMIIDSKTRIWSKPLKDVFEVEFPDGKVYQLGKISLPDNNLCKNFEKIKIKLSKFGQEILSQKENFFWLVSK